MDWDMPVVWRLKPHLSLFEGLLDFQRPDDVVSALESGAGENVMQCCLGWPPREAEIARVSAQKTVELTGGRGMVAVSQTGYSIFQRLGILGGDFVSEEGHLGCSFPLNAPP
jgi:hypothetical protein